MAGTDEWVKAEDCPAAYWSVPFSINASTFAVAEEGSARDSQRNKGFLKYDSLKNKWNEWMTYPKNANYRTFTIALDSISNTVYIFSGDKELVKINTNCQEFKSINLETSECDGAHASSLCINGRFHLFGGWEHNKHAIWNDHEKRFEDIYEFRESTEDVYKRGFTNHEVVYHKSENKVYLLGGMDKITWTDADDIWCYNVDKQEWNKLDIKLPEPMSSFVAVITMDERYVIIVKYDIFVWDLMEMVIKKCDICVPEQFRLGAERGCVIGNRQDQDLLVYGYVKRFSSKYTLISDDLIDLILKFCSNEWLHLMSFDRNDNHWKIEINTITNFLSNPL